MGDGVVPFKIYVTHKGSDEPEVRRFGLPNLVAYNFEYFTKTITELFPSIADKVYKIYWEDEDGDSVNISSDAEFAIALNSMKSGARKFYLKIQSPDQESAEDGSSVLHPGICCDSCGEPIFGFRYKCLMCKDYDLCKACEKLEVHAEHAMIRIPHPMCLDRINLYKLMAFITSSIPMKASLHRRRHSHESRSERKKKRSDKRDGHETGDEMEEGSHKHSHKKCRKQCARPLSSVMMDYINPVHFDSTQSFDSPRKAQEVGMTYLKNIASTIQKLMDPLGVNVEVKVRATDENKGEGKEKEEKKRAEEKKEEEEKQEEEETPTPSPSPSAPTQKEVRFSFSRDMSQSVKQAIDEITKKLSAQTMSNGNSTDNDGWVSFEELKRYSEGSSNGSAENIPSAPQQEGSPTQTDKVTPGTSSQSKQSEKLYPDLTPEGLSLSPEVQENLKKMLAMGFTNEGNWLGYLLKTKQGDIAQALEALDPSKKQ